MDVIMILEKLIYLNIEKGEEWKETEWLVNIFWKKKRRSIHKLNWNLIRKIQFQISNYQKYLKKGIITILNDAQM